MIWRFVIGVIVVVVLAFFGFYAWAWHSEIAPIDRPAVTAFDPAVVAQGAKLAAIGDCAVCHTTAGGRPYAGGFPVETPFGTVYGTNITPDTKTGIGNWSEAVFRRALRDGVDRRGNHLYPAFPYDHFTKATDNDIAALYAFLMTRTPVDQRNRPPDIMFPLNWRLFAAGWKLLFLSKGPYRPNRAEDDQWNRGAYLVAGLGHCGACHTPRNFLGAEQRDKALSGGEGEGWHAPALNAASPAPVPWSADQFYAYLRHGFAREHGHVAGPMQPVVRDLQKADDADVHAIAAYLASLSKLEAAERQQRSKAAQQFADSRAIKVPEASAHASAPAAEKGGTRAGPVGHAISGSEIFAGACATCHHQGGRLPISRPVELGLSTPVNNPDPRNLFHIILDGIHPPLGQRGALMPGFSGALTDQQIIALVGYVRTHFSRKPPWSDVASVLKSIRRSAKQRMRKP
jgi:mono/diheme cytochrome c family protein